MKARNIKIKTCLVVDRYGEYDTIVGMLSYLPHPIRRIHNISGSGHLQSLIRMVEPAQQIVYRHPAEPAANRLTYLMQRGMTAPGMDSNLFSGHFFFWRVLDVLRDLFRTTVSGSKQPQKWLRPALFLSGFQLYYLHQEGCVFDRVCIVCKYNSYKSFQWILIKL